MQKRTVRAPGSVLKQCNKTPVEDRSVLTVLFSSTITLEYGHRYVKFDMIFVFLTVCLGAAVILHEQTPAAQDGKVS